MCYNKQDCTINGAFYSTNTFHQKRPYSILIPLLWIISAYPEIKHCYLLMTFSPQSSTYLKEWERLISNKSDNRKTGYISHGVPFSFFFFLGGGGGLFFLLLHAVCLHIPTAYPRYQAGLSQPASALFGIKCSFLTDFSNVFFMSLSVFSPREPSSDTTVIPCNSIPFL